MASLGNLHSVSCIGSFSFPIMIRYDTRCYFNVRSKPKTKKMGKKEKLDVKTDMLRGIGKRSWESVKSVLFRI